MNLAEPVNGEKTGFQKSIFLSKNVKTISKLTGTVYVYPFRAITSTLDEVTRFSLLSFFLQLKCHRFNYEQTNTKL